MVTVATDYERVFGDDPRRAFRMAHLVGLLDLTTTEVPRLRDAWLEFHQSPDREANVGAVRIVLYCESHGPYLDRSAPKIFTLRTSPYYREERDEPVATHYHAYVFALPEGLPLDVLATMRAAATPEPVDTDARWRAALGLPERNTP